MVSVIKRPLYMWMWSELSGYKNMVAIELYRAVASWNDMGCGNFSLHFAKNKEQQEVDFLIASDNEPFLLVEAKTSDTTPSPALLKYQRSLYIPAVQVTSTGDTFRLVANGTNDILVTPAAQWLSGLP